MAAPTIYSTPVPYELPDGDCDVLIVGEAPGGQEVGQGRPFVGKAGDKLRQYLGRKGCQLTGKVGFANLSKHRPRGNKFKLLRGTDELELGLTALADTIADVKPNVVVALGNWPLYYLTGNCGRKANKPIPGTGIGSYRGSILPALDRFHNVKVIVTYHPSFIIRPGGWGVNHLFFRDLCRVSEDSGFPDLSYTPYEKYINPDADTVAKLEAEYLDAEWVAPDIETFPGGKASCVGWAWKRPSGIFAGICATYLRMDSWPLAQRMWESDTPKIFQNGTYDVSFMQRFYGWDVGGFYGGKGHDTLIASMSLMPNELKRLDFQCSLHTRFPYYKEERKEWREEGDMNILWEYNLKDCVATHEIATDDVQSGIGSQIRLLKELYG